MNVERRSMKLPSGAEFSIELAPFAEGKALFQAIVAEVRDVDFRTVDGHLDPNTLKELLCVALSSPKVEAAVQLCMVRCLYKGQKVIAETWESPTARGDYFVACVEVARDNVIPFAKPLYAEFEGTFGEMARTLFAPSPTTT